MPLSLLFGKKATSRWKLYRNDTHLDLRSYQLLCALDKRISRFYRDSIRGFKCEPRFCQRRRLRVNIDVSYLIPGASSSGGRKARGVATAPSGYIRALTIFARDSYGRPIHFRAIIVTTVDSRRCCRPQIYRYSPQDLFHRPAIRFF